MANSVSSLNPEMWSGDIQRSLFTENSAVMLADTHFRDLVAGEGDTINYPSLSYPVVQTYTPSTDITATALTAANEQLTITTFLDEMVNVDDTEVMQSKYSISSKSQQRMTKSLNNRIEQLFLAEVTNAATYIDDGSVGGTAGNNIIVTTDNVADVPVVGGYVLAAKDSNNPNRYWVVGPHVYGQMLKQRGGRPTGLGDTVQLNGTAGEAFGMNIVVNNNLPYTAVLSLVTQPTNGDTITIAGVTITLHATLVASAWADIRTDVDTTRTFIRDLINYGNGTGGTVAGTVGTDFTDVSAENRHLWRKRGLKAVDSSSADTLTLTGYGDITVAETLTDATDTWTSARQDSIVMVKGAISLVVQKPPTIELAREPKQFSTNVKALLGMGVKTFADGAREMVWVKINALGTATGNGYWLI